MFPQYPAFSSMIPPPVRNFLINEGNTREYSLFVTEPGSQIKKIEALQNTAIHETEIMRGEDKRYINSPEIYDTSCKPVDTMPERTGIYYLISAIDTPYSKMLM